MAASLSIFSVPVRVRQAVLGFLVHPGVLLSVVWPRGCLESICAWILPVTFRVRERRYHLGLYS